MIKLDIRDAQSSVRLFTEGSHVILEGQLVQGVFKVLVRALTYESVLTCLDPLHLSCTLSQSLTLFYNSHLLPLSRTLFNSFTIPRTLPHSHTHTPPLSPTLSPTLSPLLLPALPLSLSLSIPQTMGFPPAENREAALLAMSVQDPFSASLRASQHQQLLEMEEAATEAMFVIMSDVQLDRPLVSVRASLQAFHRPFVPGSIYLYFKVV